MSTTTMAKNRRVLVVDDNRLIHEDFRKCIVPDHDEEVAALDDAASELFGLPVLRSEPPDQFEIGSAYQGQEALAMVRRAIEEGTPYAVAFVDMRMPPGWDGIETIERLWEVDPDLHVVICTAYSDLGVDQIVGRLGRSDRLLILKKPFDPMEARLLAATLSEKWEATQQVRRRILGLQEWLLDAERVLAIIQDSHEELESAHTEVKDRASGLVELVRQRTIEAVATRDIAVLALAKLAESRDRETGQHLERIRAYCQVLAEELAQGGPYRDLVDGQFCEDLCRSSPLHDIGKVGIPDAVLLKPGPLTPEQFEVMKQHTVIGAEALRQAADQSDYGGFLNMAADIARHHHERFDGSGYPDGLRAEEIPLAARIVALADQFDALTSQRVYKEPLPPHGARPMIESQRGRHFDPVIVDAFSKQFDEFARIHAGQGPLPPAPIRS